MTIQMKNVVTKSNLNEQKGFKLDSVTKKIEVAIENSFLKYTDSGAITLDDTIKSGVLSSDPVLEGTKLKFTLKDGSTKEVDLTPALVDIHVNGASLSGNTLTLNVDGASDITVNLEELVQDKLATVAHQDTPTISFTGSGKENDKLQATVKVSSETKNLLEEKSDGLYATLDLAEEKLAILGLEIIELKDAFDQKVTKVIAKRSE